MNDVLADGVANDTGFADIPDVSLAAATDRVNPRQVASGVTRGTQTIMNTDGSYVTLGQVPDNSGDFGIAFFTAAGNLIYKSTSTTEYRYDTSGNLISKRTGTTDFKYSTDGTLVLKVTGDTEYRYDKATGRNYYQNGLLPDGSYGEVIAKSPYNVADAFS